MQHAAVICSPLLALTYPDRGSCLAMAYILPRVEIVYSGYSHTPGCNTCVSSNRCAYIEATCMGTGSLVPGVTKARVRSYLLCL